MTYRSPYGILFGKKKVFTTPGPICRVFLCFFFLPELYMHEQEFWGVLYAPSMQTLPPGSGSPYFRAAGTVLYVFIA